ncbi:MAG: hypothetical protein KDD46_00735 [Bdellovibrionales bacterium]|nr:hypothetical protein [Bdellovibrionales bacterium]
MFTQKFRLFVFIACICSAILANSIKERVIIKRSTITNSSTQKEKQRRRHKKIKSNRSQNEKPQKQDHIFNPNNVFPLCPIKNSRLQNQAWELYILNMPIKQNEKYMTSLVCKSDQDDNPYFFLQPLSRSYYLQFPKNCESILQKFKDGFGIYAKLEDDRIEFFNPIPKEECD